MAGINRFSISFSEDNPVILTTGRYLEMRIEQRERGPQR